MAKLISPHREVSIAGKAREYLRTHVVFPSALLGLILLVASTMGLGYQYLAKTYDGSTFIQSTGLALVGALVGWGQCRYHRYLLVHYPESLANRLRAFSKKDQSKSRKQWPMVEVEHVGRKWVPLWYLAGVLLLLGLSFAAAAWGAVYAVSAYLLPWTGFFCARVYTWKELWGPAGTQASRL